MYLLNAMFERIDLLTVEWLSWVSKCGAGTPCSPKHMTETTALPLIMSEWVSQPLRLTSVGHNGIEQLKEPMAQPAHPSV